MLRTKPGANLGRADVLRPRLDVARVALPLPLSHNWPMRAKRVRDLVQLDVMMTFSRRDHESSFSSWSPSRRPSRREPRTCRASDQGAPATARVAMGSASIASGFVSGGGGTAIGPWVVDVIEGAGRRSAVLDGREQGREHERPRVRLEADAGRARCRATSSPRSPRKVGDRAGDVGWHAGRRPSACVAGSGFRRVGGHPAAVEAARSSASWARFAAWYRPAPRASPGARDGCSGTSPARLAAEAEGEDRAETGPSWRRSGQGTRRLRRSAPSVASVQTRSAWPSYSSATRRRAPARGPPSSREAMDRRSLRERSAISSAGSIAASAGVDGDRFGLPALSVR